VNQLIEIKDIAHRISKIRGIKVVIDRDLAECYGVQTKRLNEQVKRNKDRFPPDFVFQLTEGEKTEVVANCDHLQSLKFAKALPYVFTEHGAIMAASVLNSKAAVEISVLIVRAFVQLRHVVIEHAELKREVEALRKQTEERFEIVFTVLDKLVSDGESPGKKIGFIDNEQ
jgi:phage regulator Rha-like protein